LDDAGIAFAQPKSIDLQSGRTTVLSLNENWCGKILCQCCLANTRLPMQHDDRRQLCSRVHDLHALVLHFFQRCAGPVAADFGFSLKRHAEAVGFASLAGMTDEDLAYLLGDGWPADSRNLVVNPQRDVDIAVGAVAEARTEL